MGVVSKRVTKKRSNVRRERAKSGCDDIYQWIPRNVNCQRSYCFSLSGVECGNITIESRDGSIGVADKALFLGTIFVDCYTDT